MSERRGQLDAIRGSLARQAGQYRTTLAETETTYVKKPTALQFPDPFLIPFLSLDVFLTSTEGLILTAQPSPTHPWNPGTH